MKPVLWWGTSVLFVGLLALASSARVTADEDAHRVVVGIDWKTDLEAARKAAAASNRPLWVTFRCVP